MQAIVILLFGLLGGLLARVAISRERPGGWIPSAILGMAGALFSGFLARYVGIYREGESIALAVWFIGAFVVSMIYDAAARQQRVVEIT